MRALFCYWWAIRDSEPTFAPRRFFGKEIFAQINPNRSRFGGDSESCRTLAITKQGTRCAPCFVIGGPSGTLNPHARQYLFYAIVSLACIASPAASRVHRRDNELAKTIGVCAAYPYCFWWAIRDSNPGPTGYEPVALTN